MAESAKAVLLGLTGWPLKTSLSPALHRAFLKNCGLAGSYELFPARGGELDRLFGSLAGRGFRGLNVTYPHKLKARELCSSLAGHARDLQAVNTVVFQQGDMTGYNTDVPGFLFMLSRIRTRAPYLIAGCGGVAEAVKKALSIQGHDAVVFCRDPGGCRLSGDVRSVDELADAVRARQPCTVINATTLGWRDSDTFPSGIRDLANSVFLDLNYNPGWQWRNELKSSGTIVVTGEIMLLGQAAESFRIWTGCRPDTDGVLKRMKK